MTNLIGLIGYAGSGKDAVASILADNGYMRIASGDLVREVLWHTNPLIPRNCCDQSHSTRLQDYVTVLGWEAAKRDCHEVRRLLQELGTEGVRKTLGEDVWIDETLRRVEEIGGNWCVTDIRFPNEADKVWWAGGEIWRVTRPGVGPLNGHPSENSMDDYAEGRVIRNDRDLGHLRVEVEVALKAEEEGRQK